MVSHNVFFIFLFLVFHQALFSMELVLKSGEIFICDFQGENDNRIRIKYKNVFYLVPKEMILSMDDRKSGQHVSYRYRLFTMKDGSSIKGVIAEEEKNSYTLRTQLGFLAVEKDKIAKIEKTDEKEINPPLEYKELIASSEQTKIGFSITGMANGSPLSPLNPVSYGGGWFLEPSFSKINDRWLFGYKGEYINSPGQRRFDFFNNYLYVQYNYNKSRLINFYANFGIGASYVRYMGNDNNSFSGTDPSVFFELGWQGLQFDRLFFRFALRSTYIHEAGNGLGMFGAEFSTGFKI